MTSGVYRAGGHASVEFVAVAGVLVLALWLPVVEGRSVAEWLALALLAWLASLESWLSII